ncbi:MAG: hypothetical protein H6667_20425 [Ardenticatenaceae bacterium]|nr:hypothetical protein [Ardenticatenaceae bacterium]MCB9445580.1 hypothetical protein [Ardenticatenaceae bacterium]
MAKKLRWKETAYIVAPFFLLVACLAFINFVPGRLTAVSTPSPQPENSIVVETAVSSATAIPPTSTIPPTPTLIPTATLPPDAEILLLGPPSGSSFRQNDTISFYANWPLPLIEPQQLAAYVQLDDQPVISLGELAEPNTGLCYRWQLNMSEITDTAVTLSWWVQLQPDSNSPPLLTSPTRQVTLLP